ncbi:MAG: glycosyltransferase family 4 protein [Candidatus Scalindua sp.]|nr:glycosyltransferase family 4 protein [Candidatus Scalindua sp.]
MNAGFEVSLIAKHYKDDMVDGIRIIALPESKNRIDRMFTITFKAFLLALKEKADIYHFHDPELLLIGVLLKLFTGKKIIYDVHEDYQQKILSKRWIKETLRKPLAYSFRIIEKLSSSFFDYVFTADSYTKLKFDDKKSKVIANYPPLRFINGLKKNKQDSTFELIYVGSISEDRGGYVMIEAMKYLQHTDIELHILGNCDDQELIDLFSKIPNVKYHGCLPWEEVSTYLINADVGLVLFQPVPGFLYYPGENIIKLFEYMSAGLAVIISDFPKLKKLINDIGCGISVDPENPRKIAESIEYLYKNPDIKTEMSEKGKNAFLEKYNWDNESDKVVNVYRAI